MKSNSEPPNPPGNAEAVYSKLYDSCADQIYQADFENATGLPVAPLPAAAGLREAWASFSNANRPGLMFLDGAEDICPYCANKPTRRRFGQPDTGGFRSPPCAAGLRQMAAPIRFGSSPVAFLVTSQYRDQKPSKAELSRLRAR